MKRRNFIKTCTLMSLGLLSAPGDLFAGDGKLCVVLDDAGGSGATISSLEKLAKRNIPSTVAVLPKSNYEKKALKILASYENSDIILHQQMEPINMIARGLKNGLEACPREKGEQFDDSRHAAIYNFDSPGEAEIIVGRNIKHINDYLNSLGSDKRVVGLNNHMGSLVTQKEDVMRKIAEYCIGNGLILLDSKTTHKSKMYHLGKIVGKELYASDGIHTKVYARNSNFLDKNSIEKLDKYGKLVRKGKTIITIGHLQYPKTVDALVGFVGDNYDILARISRLE